MNPRNFFDTSDVKLLKSRWIRKSKSFLGLVFLQLTFNFPAASACLPYEEGAHSKSVVFAGRMGQMGRIGPMGPMRLIGEVFIEDAHFPSCATW